MKTLLDKFISKHGYKSLAIFLLSPITVIITTPFRFCSAIYSLRVLLNGEWQQFNRFSATRAINSLFYWVQAVNIEKNSLTGTSKTIGSGDFLISRWFHLSIPSVILYWRLGAVAPVIGLFGWFAFQLLWLDTIEDSQFIIIALLILCSSTFYANLFELQNYNAFGWLFFPLGIWGLYTGHYSVAALGWLLCSFGGFTAWFTGGALSFSLAMYTMTWAPLWALVPSILKMSLHFYPLLQKGVLLEQLLSVAKGIGAVKGNKKFKRNSSLTDVINFVYFTLLYGQFFAVYLFMGNAFDIVFASMLILFGLNTLKIIRYADPGSIIMPVFTISIVLLINNFSYELLFSWLFLANPVPYFLDFADQKKSIALVPKRKPFRLTPLFEEIENFFSDVKSGERVLFCFENPKGEVGKIFDGYRAILEAGLYCASKKDFHLLPDWYLVFEYNVSDSVKSFWGRSTEDVINNAKEWSAEYIVYYTEDCDELDSLLESTRFELIQTLDWKQLQNIYKNELTVKRENLKWHLLKCK